MRADSNSDSIVTLQEAFTYARNYCNSINNSNSQIPAADMVVRVSPPAALIPCSGAETGGQSDAAHSPEDVPESVFLYLSFLKSN